MTADQGRAQASVLQGNTCRRIGHNENREGYHLRVLQGILHKLADVVQHSLYAAQVAVAYRARLCIASKLCNYQCSQAVSGDVLNTHARILSFHNSCPASHDDDHCLRLTQEGGLRCALLSFLHQKMVLVLTFYGRRHGDGWLGRPLPLQIGSVRLVGGLFRLPPALPCVHAGRGLGL